MYAHSSRYIISLIGVPNNAIATRQFEIGEIVWAKLKGHPHWPATVKQIYGSRRHMLEVFWLKDYRTSKINKGQAWTFLPNIDRFSKATCIGQQTAIREAKLLLRIAE